MTTAARTYTCPMHPEIVREEPGDCPICGMALEPVLPAAKEQGEDQELASMTRRFRASLALTVPVFLLAMSDMLPGRPVERWLAPELAAWLQLVLSAPVVLWGGAPFFRRGWA